MTEEKKSRKNSSSATILETFFSQTWQDEDVANGCLDSTLAQLSSIVDIGDRMKMLKELRNQITIHKKSVGILMKGGFKVMLIDWFKGHTDNTIHRNEESSSKDDSSIYKSINITQIQGMNMKYINNLLITIDEVADWSTEELISNRLDKTIKTCYKSCKSQQGVGSECQFAEYLKQMWIKYRGLIST